jgi:ABC-type branched-subunit amino acid transport system ATPase component
VTVLSLGKKLAEGTPADIRSHREVVNAYLGG